jgi:hypothetical protein
LGHRPGWRPTAMFRSLIRPAELRLLPEASLVWNIPREVRLKYLVEGDLRTDHKNA